MQEINAVALLKKEGYTLILYNESEYRVERARGVAPLLSLLDSEEDVSSFCAVDKVVGKAAAFLYILLGIRRIYALTVSESARALLEKNQIKISFESCVDRIKNRDGTGFCPMESAVLSESDPSRALSAIRSALHALRNKK
jgi:hypothetical protein